MKEYDTKEVKGSGSNDSQSADSFEFGHFPTDLINAESWIVHKDSDRKDVVEDVQLDIAVEMYGGHGSGYTYRFSGSGSEFVMVSIDNVHGHSQAVEWTDHVDEFVDRFDTWTVETYHDETVSMVLCDAGDVNSVIEGKIENHTVTIDPHFELHANAEFSVVEDLPVKKARGEFEALLSEFSSALTSNMSWSDVVPLYHEDENGNTHKEEGNRDAANLLEDKYEPIVLPETEEMMWYDPDSGHYRDWGDKLIRREIESELGTKFTSTIASHIMDRLRARCTLIDTDVLNAGDYGARMICLKNGVLNIDEAVVNGEINPDALKDHSSHYNFTYQLPVEFDPDVGSGIVSDTLDDITGRPEDRLVLEEIAGMALLPNDPVDRILMIYGDGANGKSTYTGLVTSMLGIENVSAVSLQKLNENTFSKATMADKHANISSDIPERKITDMSHVKEITGGDPSDIEDKGITSYTGKVSATQIFGCNSLPYIENVTSKNIRRRLVPVNLPYTFGNADGDKEADPNLPSKLAEEEAKTEFLNHALKGIHRYEKQQDVSLPESEMERARIYLEQSDDYARFVGECLRNEEGESVANDTVMAVYNAWCNKEQIEPRHRNTVLPQLEKVPGFNRYNTQKRVGDGDRVRSMDQATLTETGEELAPDEALFDDPWIESPTDDSVKPLTEVDSGMNDVRVEVLRNESTGDQPSVDCTVECVTTGHRMQLMSWDTKVDFAADLEVGSEVVISDAHYVEPELRLLKGVSEIRVVSVEASQSELDDSGGDDESGEVSQEDRVEIVMDVVASHKDDYDDGVPMDVIVDEVDAVDADTVQSTVDSLCKQGDMYSPLDDGRVFTL